MGTMHLWHVCFGLKMTQCSIGSPLHDSEARGQVWIVDFGITWRLLTVVIVVCGLVTASGCLGSWLGAATC